MRVDRFLTLDELRQRVESATDGYDILRLDNEYEGSCPCFWVHGVGFDIEGHCWRPSCPRHQGVGLHADIPPDIGRRMAKLLTELDWYGEWTWTPIPR